MKSQKIFFARNVAFFGVAENLRKRRTFLRNRRTKRSCPSFRRNVLRFMRRFGTIVYDRRFVSETLVCDGSIYDCTETTVTNGSSNRNVVSILKRRTPTFRATVPQKCPTFPQIFCDTQKGHISRKKYFLRFLFSVFNFAKIRKKRGQKKEDEKKLKLFFIFSYT